MDRTKLKIDEVDTDCNNANYTCTVTFTLGGVTGSVSETINVFVSGKNKENEDFNVVCPKPITQSGVYFNFFFLFLNEHRFNSK